MRIAPPMHCIPASVQPSRVPAVDVTPLPPERAQELIGMGFFKQDPGKVIWSLTSSSVKATPGAAKAIQAVPLPQGLHMQAWGAGKADGSLLPSLFEAANLVQPHLEQAGAVSDNVARVADGMAVLMAAPEIFHAWAGPSRWSPRNVALYGVNLLRTAGIANQFLHIPHVDTPLQVVTMIFQCGDEVFVAAKPKGAVA